jgi:diphthamide biosynthesis methyltransferase
LEDAHIYYDSTEELKTKNVKAPFCFIIPGKMHFMEKEVLESFNN